MDFKESKLAKPKTGIMAGMLLAHRESHELFNVSEVSNSGYIIIESLEDEYRPSKLLSVPQLADYMIAGEV